MNIREDRYYNVIKGSDNGVLNVGDSLYLDDGEVIVTDEIGAVTVYDLKDIGKEYKLEEDDTMELVVIHKDQNPVWMKKQKRDIEYIYADEDDLGIDME